MVKLSRRYSGRLTRFATSAAFAYSAIVALQLKVMWAIWQFKDLTAGDTQVYYTLAATCFERGKVPFAWSPLYTSYCALLLNLSRDAWVNIILQRMTISLLTAALFLALLRRLLPPALAWFVAAWWVVLPITFNALYEVHEFAVIPVLLAWLMALCPVRVLAKAGTVFILWVASALMRNEVSLAAAGYTLICLVTDLVRARLTWAKGEPDKKFNFGGVFRIIKPYVVAMVGVALIVAFAYIRSTEKGAYLMANFKAKHTENVVQIYAFNYQQRHPEWNKSPWTDGEQLAKETFGSTGPTMMEAIKSNPGAMLDYFLWNLFLIPNGLQILLFNVMAGTNSPDYAPVVTNFWQATILSVLVLAILGFGLVRTWQQRRWFRNEYMPNRIWCLTVMACLSVTSVIVMFLQRPRPSYIFTFGMTLMYMTGFCLWRLASGTRLAGAVGAMTLPLMLATICIAPSFYVDRGEVDRYRGALPMADEYHLLQPVQAAIANKSDNVLVWDSGSALLFYTFGRHATDVKCQFVEFSGLPDADKNSTISKLVAKQHIGWILLDDLMLQYPVFKEFSRGTAPPGWRLVALKNTPVHKLMLFERRL